MTDQEIMALQKQLESGQIPEGVWFEKPETTINPGGLDVKALIALRNLMEAQIHVDVAELDKAQEQLKKLESGGGA